MNQNNDHNENSGNQNNNENQNNANQNLRDNQRRRQELIRNLFNLLQNNIVQRQDNNEGGNEEQGEEIFLEGDEDEGEDQFDNDEQEEGEGEDEEEFDFVNNIIPYFRMDEVNEQDSEIHNNNISFDTTLPNRHNYLGEIEYVEENMKSNLLEGGTILKDLPILALKNVVLLPGEVIPLKIFDRNERMMFLDITGQIPFKHFGILHINDQNTHSKMGTTVQINSIKVTGSLIRILAVGIQRFEVHSLTINQRSSMVYVDAKLLDDKEASVTRLLKNISPVSPLRCSNGSLNKMMMRNGSHFHPLIFNEFDSKKLMKKAKDLIINNLHYLNKDVEENVNNDVNNSVDDLSQYCFHSTNPTQFSFWATKMLPIDLSIKQVFLEIPSTYFRLIEIIRVLERYNNIYCKVCSTLLSNKEHIFSMSVDGPSSSFVNPHGYVHQLCTLRRVNGVYLVGFPTARDSWFPSYKWTILQCVSCHSHLGWKFTTETRNMEPKFFYGLSRANITTDPNTVDNQNGEEMSDEN
eukprot:TRINITY_DN10607_c0_g1_i1.p1 TRINITY_DN10607_c0_g1~~TRINITY_DN10607_c0_g1_i1.p1  ORF type:complete len:521 (-),score=137.40 TRINITY_DN10607_c0_g1_i1:55-1617(-)